jgi:hypothetical protein
MKNYFKIVAKLLLGLGKEEKVDLNPLDIMFICIFLGISFFVLIGTLQFILVLLIS